MIGRKCWLAAFMQSFSDFQIWWGLGGVLKEAKCCPHHVGAAGAGQKMGFEGREVSHTPKL